MLSEDERQEIEKIAARYPARETAAKVALEGTVDCDAIPLVLQPKKCRQGGGTGAAYGARDVAVETDDGEVDDQSRRVDRRTRGPGHPESVAVPGQTSHLTFIADQQGTFRFHCTVTCGNMHPFMTGKLEVGQNTLLWRAIALTAVALVAGAWKGWK